MTTKISPPLIQNRFFGMLAIFLGALALKLLIFFRVTDPIIFYKYPYFAEKIGQGVEIGERILDLSPLYLTINLLFYKLYGGGWETLAVFQIFLGSLNCIFIYLIAEKFFDRSVALIAALFLLLYGNLTLIELTLEPETFVLFFNSLVILSLIHARDKDASHPVPRRWVLPGSLIGLAVITKPNALLLLPLAVIWIWLGKGPSVRKFKAIFFLVMAAALLVAPVTLRNYLKFQDFVLVTADGGKVFFHGNGPGSTGMERADLPDQGFIEESHGDPDYAHALFRKKARNLTGRHLTPSECSRFWTDYTLEYIRTHLPSAIRLEIKKFIYFWSDYEVHDIDSTYKNYRAIQSWPLLSFGVLAVLGLLGISLSLPEFGRAFLLYFVIIIYLLSVLIFFAASRYRLPAAPFLAIFAAYALASLSRQFREKQFRKFWLCIAIIVGLWTATNHLFQTEVKAFDRWQRATRLHYSLGGNASFQKGLYRQAAREYEQAIALQPNFAPAHNRLGMSYALMGQLEKAAEQFQKVIALAPAIDQGYLNLGLLYILKKKPSQALPLLEKALSLNPENKKAREQIQKIKLRSDKRKPKGP